MSGGRPLPDPANGRRCAVASAALGAAVGVRRAREALTGDERHERDQRDRRHAPGKRRREATAARWRPRTPAGVPQRWQNLAPGVSGASHERAGGAGERSPAVGAELSCGSRRRRPGTALPSGRRVGEREKPCRKIHGFTDGAGSGELSCVSSARLRDSLDGSAGALRVVRLQRDVGLRRRCRRASHVRRRSECAAPFRCASLA